MLRFLWSVSHPFFIFPTFRSLDSLKHNSFIPYQKSYIIGKSPPQNIAGVPGNKYLSHSNLHFLDLNLWHSALLKINSAWYNAQPSSRPSFDLWKKLPCGKQSICEAVQFPDTGKNIVFKYNLEGEHFHAIISCLIPGLWITLSFIGNGLPSSSTMPVAHWPWFLHIHTHLSEERGSPAWMTNNLVKPW